MTAGATQIGAVHDAPKARSRGKQLGIMGALLAAAVGVALVGRTFRPKPPLPLYGAVPAFALTDQAGAPFTDANLRGKAWVADFIFTHCKSTCPKLTQRMKDLEKALDERGKGAGVRFVSFSVDPDNDTPAVLSAYATKVGADTARWSFVTGESADVQKTIVDGFKVAIAKVERSADEHDILHGNWFAVGDGRGNVRGYYITETDDDMRVLADDVVRLEGESGR